jgi:glyoxylase-like metal-dependent hydrolase (beta-lactamase superfamily II)
MPGATTHKTTIDVELAGGEELAFGDVTFKVIAAPGHTPGSVCYLLERKGLRALFTGDVVQSLSQASSGALGTYAAYLPPLYGGSARDYLASLRKLRALPAPDLVLPGHPRMDPAPQSPRLGEQRWRALLDGGVAEMERLLARYEADGAGFLDGAPKALRPGLYYAGDHGGAALYAVKAAKGLVVFDAPGGASLPAVLSERLGKLGAGGEKVAAVFLTSADKEATAGLPALVRAAGCKVVVAREGVAAVRAMCPAGTTVLAAEDLPAKGGDAPVTLPELRVIPLGGRGAAPVAYHFRWAGKAVLASGTVPRKPSVPSSAEVARAVNGPGGDARAYLRSLAVLGKEAPEVWLPAVPVHGQNANLYDRDWEKVLTHNRYLFSQ